MSEITKTKLSQESKQTVKSDTNISISILFNCKSFEIGNIPSLCEKFKSTTIYI